MDDGRFTRSILLDFYGELLTERQRRCFSLHYNEDLSLAEIAEQSGISRQGVWDNIRRAEAALTELEEKTGLVRRFLRREKCLESLRERLTRLCDSTKGETLKQLHDAINEIDALERED